MPKIGWEGAADIAYRIAERTAVVRPRDLDAWNVPHQWLDCLMWIEFKKVGPGLYTPRDYNVPPRVLFGHKYPRLTLGLTTALHLHGLLAEPEIDWWIMGNHERKKGFSYPNARVLRAAKPHEDRTEVKWKKLITFNVHTPLRAALDCIRFRKHLGADSVRTVLADLIQRDTFTHEQLIERARQLHVYAPLLELLPPS